MTTTTEEKNKKRLNFTIWSRETDRKIVGIFKGLHRILRGIGAVVIVLCLFAASLIIIKDEIVFWSTDSDYYDYDEEFDIEDEDEYVSEDCNVYGINLHGDLFTYISPENYDQDGYPIVDQAASEDIIYKIMQAEKDNDIKAIVLEIDSYGGLPVAAEEIANALKQAQKPAVALIREGGASAAYWAATGADTIFASENSDIGGIAVTMSYLDYVDKNQKEGLTYISLTSGKFKDAGNPDRKLTGEERELLMRDVNIIHNNFVKAVAENRKLDIQKVTELADGSSMLGEMALASGLIDGIGGMAEVEEYLQEKIGEEVKICWQ